MHGPHTNSAGTLKAWRNHPVSATSRVLHARAPQPNCDRLCGGSRNAVLRPSWLPWCLHGPGALRPYSRLRQCRGSEACVEALVRFRSKHFLWLATRRTLLVSQPTHDLRPQPMQPRMPRHVHTRHASASMRATPFHSMPLLKLGSSARGWDSEPHFWLRASFDGRHIVRPGRGMRCRSPYGVSYDASHRPGASRHSDTRTHTLTQGIRTIEHTQLAFSRATNRATVQKSLVPRGHALYI